MRDRDRKMKDVDTDWWRTAILTHNFLTMLIPHSRPFLALLLLLDQGCCPSSASPWVVLTTAFALTSWWLQLVDGTGVYIISQCPCILVVNPHDPLLDVNLCERLTSKHRMFSGNHLFTQLEHPFPEITDWQLGQRSIWNGGIVGCLWICGRCLR